MVTKTKNQSGNGNGSELPSCDISVVIPVLNEEGGLADCYTQVTQTLDQTQYSFEIIFVDDGSADGSAKILADLATTDARVTFIKLLHNIGQQRAMYAAFDHCRGKAIITYDADLQFHPDCLPELAKHILAGRDIVGGVRVKRKDSLWLNGFPSYIGKTLINHALRIDLQDFGAVKAYSHDLVQTMRQSTSRLIIIPAMAYMITRNMIEIPIQHQVRKTGQSKWSVFSRMELYLDLYTMYARRPFEWMMIGSVIMLVAAFLLMIGVISYRLLVSGDFSGLIIFFDAFLWVTGLCFFSLSFIGEFIVRIFRGQPLDTKSVTQSIMRTRDK